MTSLRRMAWREGRCKKLPSHRFGSRAVAVRVAWSRRASVHANLKDVRLKAAAAMLSERRTVTDVALSVGFENLNHFSKVFRAFHGVNPRDYART